MDAEIKKGLKDAKELVKNKDFAAALEVCKVVLKNDKNNYLGWVLSAVSFQELGQSDKALSAFTKATELQPEQLTAWQGLAAFLEQERSRSVVTTDSGQQLKEYSEKLSATYSKLEVLFSSEPLKQNIILKKHCELLGAIGDTDKCVKIASSLLSKGDKETVRMVAKVLSPFMSKLDTRILEQVSNSLSPFLSSNEQEDLFCKELYLQTMVQLKRYSQVITVAQNILLSDATNFKSSEAVCIAYVEDSSLAIESSQVETAINAVAATHPNHGYILLAKGKWLLTKGRAMEAKQLLEVQMNKKENQNLAKALLCDAYKQLYQWPKVEELSRSALKDEESDWWMNKLAESLLEQGRDSQLKEVADLLERMQDTSSVKIFRALLYLRTNQLDKCSTIINSLERDESTISCLLLKAEYLQKTSQFEESVRLLDKMCVDHPQNVDVLLNSAKMMWKKSEERLKCVTYFLNVIKINRDIAEPYIYLGEFYGEQSQNASSLQRAMRCLEKAFQLDPHNAGTSQKLVDLYLLSHDTGSVLKLLDAVIQASPRDCRWAWIKKGHLHLKAFRKEKRVVEQDKEAKEAVSCLQNALDKAEDSSTWESLGDAYIARGSYTAALKAFQRAAELDDGSVYSAYQIASIKQILGEYAEAVLDFQALLEKKPDYVPALKGLAETLLCQAGDYQTDGFVGRLVGCCSNIFEPLVRAAQIQPGLACLWSLLGNVCLLLRSVPESHFQRLRVPALLLSPENVNKREVMELGPKFFSSALKLLPDSASLWHNLALCYQSCWLLDDAEKTKASALIAIKKAIALEPKDSTHWDLLGQIAQQPSISQHAFIRALELNPNSPGAAATWTHLGSLYMKHGNLQLAHECFKRAQNVDPFHVAAWIGQAHIAEQLSPAEAMDLFRHTVSIGNGCPGQCEGSPSYAQWVISTLADSSAKETALFRYNIVQMHAVPAAVDGLVRYVALNPDDSSALNLLGLLYERQGLLSKAEDAFLQGIECLNLDSSNSAASRIDKMKANLARVYTTLDRCDDATELYGSLQESELSSACGLALAHFKANRHAEAYVTYEAALQWLASDDEKRSHLLVAMAMAAFRRDFPEAGTARDLLLESSQLQPPSVYGLLALGALGLLTDDETLTSAAFQELLPYQTESRYVADISCLTAYYHFSAGNALQGRIEIIRNIHMLPNEPELWTLLASYQASLVAHQSAPIRPEDGLLVARCAETAFHALRQRDDSVAESEKPSTDVAQIISLIGLGYLLAGKSSSSLTAAVRSVHCNPHSAASWSVLLAAALPTWSSSGSDSEHRLEWLKKLVEHLRRRCDVTAYSRLAPWLGSYERRLISLLN